jgi:hypothetical protein
MTATTMTTIAITAATAVTTRMTVRRKVMRTVIVALALAPGLAACGKSGGSDPAAGGGSAAPRDAVIEAWKSAKLTPSPLTAATVTFGKDCQSGTVEGIDVLVCNFGSAADAKAAEDQGLTWVGAVTGASQAHGAALVVLADRRKADPDGKTINRLLKLAPK